MPERAATDAVVSTSFYGRSARIAARIDFINVKIKIVNCPLVTRGAFAALQSRTRAESLIQL